MRPQAASEVINKFASRLFADAFYASLHVGAGELEST